MALELLTDILIVFAIALIVGMIFNRIKVLPQVAFILTGIIVGPYGLSIISDQEQVASSQRSGSSCCCSQSAWSSHSRTSGKYG